MVQDWLSKFGYSYRFKMSGVNRGEFVLKDLKSGIESNLVDNGFGISQSLPLAVALETIDQKTILIDSPEAFEQFFSVQTGVSGKRRSYFCGYGNECG